MSGFFLNINKEKGITSFDVIRKLRKILNIKTIGHSGTLDPLASGVLQIGVGDCAKLLDYLGSDKTYIADIIFGYNSETMDNEGEKIFVKTPDFTKDKLVEILNSFIGKTNQTPPKYSAIKIKGQKLCDIARRDPDKKISIPSREITIYSIDLLDFKGDKAKIKVHCAKGTYIRSLVFDIGQKLGCGAYMSDLIRTSAGNFKIENSQGLDCAQFNKINPLDTIELDKYELNEIEYKRIRNGNFIYPKRKMETEYVLLTKNNKLVSLAYLSDNQSGLEGVLKPKKNFKED